MSSKTVSSAFEDLLRSLCLQDFPCGMGSWSKPRKKGREDWSWGYTEQDEGTGGSVLEEQEDLIELLTSPLSPWRQEESWSPQATALRQLSIRTPARLSDSFIHEYFRTLRIVDKGVSVIDDGLLRFTKLEELVLTANYISDLPSVHFPKSLRVLELYGNQVSSLNSLCRHSPPRLQHLGLGCNKLGSSADTKFLTASFWPELVSLDLSWSGFVEQLALVDSLSTLPRLRTLALEGNPITLTPSYPGFILDSLPRLRFLDGNHVTPDDRHRFSGLAKRRDAVADEAVVTVTAHRIRGIPDPSLTTDNSVAEFPVVTYSYLVTYEFLSPQPSGNKAANIHVYLLFRLVKFSACSRDIMFHSVNGIFVAQPWNFPYTTQLQHPLGIGSTSEKDLRILLLQTGGDPVPLTDLGVPVAIEENVDPTSLPRNSEEQYDTTQEVRKNCERERCDTAPSSGLPAGREDSGQFKDHACQVTANSTPKLPWAEVIECDHTRVHHVRDLAILKSFFLQGLHVTVEEEKVLSWPASVGENSGAKAATDKKAAAKESARPASNTVSNQRPKDKKKKKESQIDLVQEAPVRRTLGSAHVDLQNLVSAGDKVHWLCNFGVLLEQGSRATASQEKESSKKLKEDKKKDDKKVKPAGESTAMQRNTPSSKGKSRGKKESEAEGHTENFPNQMEPLTLEISIHLQKWQAASQAHRKQKI
ncbi:leucine-rich repeat-containing protein 43-like [Megalops cyprinoides]|uniref:leucine-rich repeat-containing protein 43-like n=1 Tax=Megalops cyprinoides TaxID=118141 RepID=UPI00186505B8|nr:leucine-rich repeat-containing protein 43-like [Megalops cyprinoides]